MDPKEKEKEGEEEILPSQDQQEMIKTVKEKCCVDCNATKTPLWRSGPAGSKSLCNACGIRYRKKRGRTATATVDLKSGEEEKIKEEKETTLKKKRNGKCGKLNVKWRQRLMALGERVVLFQRRRSQLKKRQRFYRKLGEVEQAAVLLMALSCGSVLD